MIHMDCPKCNNAAANITCGKCCDACGCDLVLYKLAQDMSNRYYNIGLRRANEGALTDALKSLKISLQINKHNINARNLLGLLHWQTGRIGEALCQWSTSKKHQPENNLAVGYLDGFYSDLALVEKYSEAMIKYNEALVFAEKYSEDLSEIRLKRAIEIIPNFVDAMNALALHHINSDEKPRAATLIERVLTIDNKNETAKKYYFEIFKKPFGEEKSRTTLGGMGAKIARPPALDEAKKPKTTGNPFAARTAQAVPKVSSLPGILAAIIGMAAMFLFMQFLIFPGLLSDRDEAYAQLQQQAASNHLAMQDLLAARDGEIAELNERFNDLSGINDTQASELSDLQNQLTVYDAAALLALGEASLAMQLLETVSSENLSSTALAVYSDTKMAATPLVEQIYFALGRDLFNAGNFAEARIALERAAMHPAATANTVTSNEVLYYLGRIAQEDGNLQLASAFFTLVAENHPTWARRNAANQRLMSLN